MEIGLSSVWSSQASPGCVHLHFFWSILKPPKPFQAIWETNQKRVCMNVCVFHVPLPRTWRWQIYRSPFFCRSYDNMLICSCVHKIMWSYHHMIIWWSYADMTIWSYDDHMCIWSYHCMNMWSDYISIRPYGHIATPSCDNMTIYSHQLRVHYQIMDRKFTSNDVYIQSMDKSLHSIHDLSTEHSLLTRPAELVHY